MPPARKPPRQITQQSRSSRSRDRQGAPTNHICTRRPRSPEHSQCSEPKNTQTTPSWSPLRILPNSRCCVNRHRLSLLIQYIFYRCSKLLLIPQIPRAAMSRPPFPFGRLKLRFCQRARRICFQIFHDPFRFLISLHDYMHVITPDMCGEEPPASEVAHRAARTKHRLPPRFVQKIGGLVHAHTFELHTHCALLAIICAIQIMRPIYRSSSIAMQARPISCKSDEERPCPRQISL